MRGFIALVLIILASGCSTIPESVQLPESVTPVSYQEVAGAPEENKSKMARWGGVVVSIENKSESTLLEMVHFPLRGYGRPLVRDESIGRFRVYVDGFLDPMVYQKGRLMTFAGEVKGTEEGIVGEHKYLYPTLKADGYHLWKDIDRIEVSTISVWPSPFHCGYSPFGWRGSYWGAGGFCHQRVTVRRRHDHYRNYHQDDHQKQRAAGVSNSRSSGQSHRVSNTSSGSHLIKEQ